MCMNVVIRETGPSCETLLFFDVSRQIGLGIHGSMRKNRCGYCIKGGIMLYLFSFIRQAISHPYLRIHEMKARKLLTVTNLWRFSAQGDIIYLRPVLVSLGMRPTSLWYPKS